ncbi:MAG: hypothetical protein O8C61_13450 [Candidatus Methanoperedens sp.]|nr:hypothetical protein [Candidatus Methanoperedens sp.]
MTGCQAAVVFGFKFKNALIARFDGVLIAAVIMTVLNTGINIFNGI